MKNDLMKAKAAISLGFAIPLAGVLLLASCSSGKPAMTPAEKVRTECVGGVVYYMFRENAGYAGYGFMAPKYRRDGTLALCKPE